MLAPDNPIFQHNKKKAKLNVEEVNSHLLRAYILAGNNHPAKDFSDLFSKDNPIGVLTYEWSLGLGKGKGVLQVLNDSRVLQDSRVPKDLNGKRILRVWIDVLFIDQLSKNIPVELAIAQGYYILCLLHIVAGSSTLLDRGWCLWELGLRAHAQKDSLIIGALQKKVRPVSFHV